MSSKLHRDDGVASEPVAWSRVASRNAQGVDGLPAPFNPMSSGSPSEDSTDPQLQAAYQQGLKEGHAAGRQETGAQVEATQLGLARTIEELAGLRSRFRHEAEEDIVALALAIARRILHRELTMAPEALLGLVNAALEKLEVREVHRVRVSRDDAQMVQQFFEQMGLPHRIEVIADPGLPRGAAILDSTRGLLDASVETQLAEIERGFSDLVRRA